jgi:magnesium transporter
MIHKYQYKKLTWIDLESPTSNEVREIMNEYNVQPLVAEEMLLPTLKPKVDVYPNNIYLILHFPTLKKNTGDEDHNQEIDFVIGKDFIITAHYDAIDPLHNFSKVFEVNSILDRSEMGEHAGYIFYYMLRHIYHQLMDDLESIRASLTAAEDKIFHGEEKKMVFKLSYINRDLLAFKDAINLHKEVLNSFEIAATKFFGKDFDYHLRDLIGEYYKVQNEVQNSKDFLEELRRTNDSLLSTKQNETMRVLTIMAFVTFPLSLIAAIFGMNTHYLPLVGSNHDFWIVILIMLALTTSFFAFFKYKKWL